MNTTEKAFAAYKKEVAKYARIVHEIRKKHGAKKIDPLTLDSHDYHRLEQGTTCLRMVEAVLGLTAAEVAEVEKANGIHDATEKTPAPGRKRPRKENA